MQERKLTLGSLFDGISGFPLAALQCGIETKWTAEIDRHCVEISHKHFPEAKQLGDLTKINGRELEPVDIISFGSPCQNLSICGNRDGLSGEESKLFHEALRIVNEMREATNGEKPQFIIWENVPGAFSSNRGNDFRVVLQEITKSNIPMPSSGRWAKAGMVRGGGWCKSIAWRQLNAQFWGVPQRRKRLYLVGDFGSDRASEILFLPESLCGHIGENENRWSRNVTGTPGGTRTANQRKGIGQPIALAKVASTLRAGAGMPKHKADILGRIILDTSQGKSVPRKLTPLECERIQGFPDNWTKVCGMKDTPRYKALGNSLAVPCARRIFQGIVYTKEGGI